MAKVTTTTHKDSSGSIHRTEKTTYSDGRTHSVTRKDGGYFNSGKIESITRTDGKGNSKTEKP